MSAAGAAIFLDMPEIAGVRVTVIHVLQYEQAPGQWRDLSKREDPAEAFERRDIFEASWGERKDGLQNLQVVRREITDTVIEDPRLPKKKTRARAKA